MSTVPFTVLWTVQARGGCPVVFFSPGGRVAFRAKPPKQLFRSARAMFRSYFFAPITLKKREEKGERKGRKGEKGKEKEGKEFYV